MESAVGTFAVLIVLGAPICGAYTAVVASAKGYSGVAWFFAGLFFNIIALIAASGLPVKQKL